LRKKAQFQLSLQLGPNVKDKRKPTKKLKKKVRWIEGPMTMRNERENEGLGKKKDTNKTVAVTRLLSA
jgi:hypothetical protein